MSKKRHKKAPVKHTAHEWGKCEVCEQHAPLIPQTGMCGACTFGDADAFMPDAFPGTK